MEKFIKIVIPLVMIFIILIILTIVMLKYNTKLKESVDINVASTEIVKVENTSLFFKIDYNIKKYYQYLRGK